MTYKFELTMSCDISRAVVEDMIMNIVEKQTGKKIDKIEIVYDVDDKFSGYTVHFVPEISHESKSTMQTKELRVKRVIDKTWQPMFYQ